MVDCAITNFRELFLFRQKVCQFVCFCLKQGTATVFALVDRTLLKMIGNFHRSFLTLLAVQSNYLNLLPDPHGQTFLAFFFFFFLHTTYIAFFFIMQNYNLICLSN